VTGGRYAPKLLIDECLSPDLATDMRDRGLVCEHINDVKAKRNLKRLLDPAVAIYALARDLIIVTRNTSDFRRLYAAKPLHPGLVLFDCPEQIQFSTELQRQLLVAAVDGVPNVSGIGAVEPLQEVVVVGVRALGHADLAIDMERFHLPVT
jgi:predicted nuclease of predicted toxin-antitoxin system